MDLKLWYKALGPIMIAGGIILGIGLYYLVDKAGIPYQDPPLDLQIQYAVNMGIGKTLTKTGACISVATCVARTIIAIVLRKKNKPEE